MDTEYGEHRDVDHGDGGYVMILELKAELGRLKEIHIDVKTYNQCQNTWIESSATMDKYLPVHWYC